MSQAQPHAKSINHRPPVQTYVTHREAERRKTRSRQNGRGRIDRPERERGWHREGGNQSLCSCFFEKTLSPSLKGSGKARAEWCIFVPCKEVLTAEALGGKFDGPCDPRAGDEGVEGRADVYTAVTEAIGLKRRGTKGRVELKLRVAPAEGATEAAEEGAIKGIEMWRKWKLGKGMPEAETLAQLHAILGDHGFLDSHVTTLLACEEGRKDVTVAKKRVEKTYEAEGMHAEDCLVEANGKQWRSFAVEGAVDKAFLASHPVGQKLYAHSQEEGAVLHGYPGFLLHV